MVTVNWIGAGKLGKTIAYLMHKHDLAIIGGVMNRSLHSAQAAVRFIGAGQAVHHIAVLPKADITFITTPDDTISMVSELLSDNQHYQSNDDQVVVHCSGSLSSSLLKGSWYAASIHPAMSFSHPEVAIQQFYGVYCGVEGEPEAIAKLTPLFEKLGAQLFTLNSSKKNLYHIANVMGANFLVTLYAQALQTMEASGVESNTAQAIIYTLMTNVLNNIKGQDAPIKALTGPIQRGDVSTIERHLVSIQSTKSLAFYKCLAHETLMQCTDLDTDSYHALEQLLVSK